MEISAEQEQLNRSIERLKESICGLAECSLCLEVRDKYFLDCGEHSFCQDCVRKSKYKDKADKIKHRCPVCRVDYEIPRSAKKWETQKASTVSNVVDKVKTMAQVIMDTNDIIAFTPIVPKKVVTADAEVNTESIAQRTVGVNTTAPKVRSSSSNTDTPAMCEMSINTDAPPVFIDAGMSTDPPPVTEAGTSTDSLTSSIDHSTSTDDLEPSFYSSSLRTTEDAEWNTMYHRYVKLRTRGQPPSRSQGTVEERWLAHQLLLLATQTLPSSRVARIKDLLFPDKPPAVTRSEGTCTREDTIDSIHEEFVVAKKADRLLDFVAKYRRKSIFKSLSTMKERRERIVQMVDEAYELKQVFEETAYTVGYRGEATDKLSVDQERRKKAIRKRGRYFDTLCEKFFPGEVAPQAPLITRTKKAVPPTATAVTTTGSSTAEQDQRPSSRAVPHMLDEVFGLSDDENMRQDKPSKRTPSSSVVIDLLYDSDADASPVPSKTPLLPATASEGNKDKQESSAVVEAKVSPRPTIEELNEKASVAPMKMMQFFGPAAIVEALHRDYADALILKWNLKSVRLYAPSKEKKILFLEGRNVSDVEHALDELERRAKALTAPPLPKPVSSSSWRPPVPPKVPPQALASCSQLALPQPLARGDFKAGVVRKRAVEDSDDEVLSPVSVPSPITNYTFPQYGSSSSSATLTEPALRLKRTLSEDARGAAPSFSLKPASFLAPGVTTPQSLVVNPIAGAMQTPLGPGRAVVAIANLSNSSSSARPETSRGVTQSAGGERMRGQSAVSTGQSQEGPGISEGASSECIAVPSAPSAKPIPGAVSKYASIKQGADSIQSDRSVATRFPIGKKRSSEGGDGAERSQKVNRSLDQQTAASRANKGIASAEISKKTSNAIPTTDVDTLFQSLLQSGSSTTLFSNKRSTFKR